MPALDGMGGVVTAAAVDGRLEMFLANTLDALEGGRRLIGQYLETSPLDSLVLNRIEVVFEEVVANIVRHGFYPRSEQLIFVAVVASPHEIELIFEDDGIVFDPLASPLRARSRSLETVDIGGLGLPLIRKLSSRARYERLEPNVARRRIGDREFAPVNRLIVSIAR